MVYLLCFAASALLAYWAQNAKKKRKLVFFSILSVGVTVALAGLRGLSVGTDTSHYYEQLWQTALRSRSVFAFLKTYWTHYPSREMIYALLMGASAKLTGNFHVFLTLVHLIIVGCVYIGAFRLRRYASPSFLLLLFYLFYYNHSLNIIRQYMAMAVLFLAVADLIGKNYKRYILAVIIAIMMHNSAFLGFLPMILYYLLYPQNRLKSISLQKRLLLYAIIVLGVLFVKPAAGLLIDVGLLSRKFQYYVEADGQNTYAVARVLALTEVAGILLYLHSYRSYNEKADFFLICTIAFCVLYQIAASISYGRRIPAYFSLLNITSLGILVRCQRSKANAQIIRAVVVAAAVFYWVMMYGYFNTSRTIPYVLGV